MIDEISLTISNTIKQFAKMNAMQIMIDEYLEYRECSDFDKNWCEADKSIQHLSMNNAEFKESESKLREMIFKMVISKTKDNDLAGYISDDAGLIYSNLFFNCDNSFINQLYESYKSNQLPK